MRFAIALCCVGLLTGGSSATAATYAVMPDGSGDFPTIQDAVDSAVDTDVIELGDGLFTGDGNRDVDYQGKAITIRAQGGAAACTIDCGGTMAEPHRGFLLTSGEGPDSVLEGVTITGGYAPLDATAGSSGGAILCVGSSPTLRACNFVDNFAPTNGGGMMAIQGSSVVLEDCRFEGNDAADTSGGLDVREDSGAVLTDCDFIGNTAVNTTGGFLCFSGSTCTLTRCYFEGNQGLQAGGGAIAAATGDLIDCEFVDNIAVENSGGFAITFFGSGTLTRCRFVGNQSGGISGGFGIGTDDAPSTVTLTECEFIENTAGDTAGASGNTNSEITYVDCLFDRNSAGVAGGALRGQRGAILNVETCTFAFNDAPSGANIVLLTADSSVNVNRSILSFGAGGAAIDADMGGSVSLACTDVFGNAGGDFVGPIAGLQGVDGNFSADPLFCDPMSEDFTLLNTSPCLPGQHPDGAACELVGAFGVGCVVTPTVQSSWGAIKETFRP